MDGRLRLEPADRPAKLTDQVTGRLLGDVLSERQMKGQLLEKRHERR